MKLMSPPFPTLAGWYGRPLSSLEADELLDRARSRQQRFLLRGRTCLVCRLAVMAARFWLGEPIENDFGAIESLARLRSHRGRILAHLIYGQLLMSQRIRGAMEHLDYAFAEARHLFAPGDYFVVLKRHTLLRRLPLCTVPLPPEDLPDLLSMASVISQLEGESLSHYTIDRTDILG